MNPTPSCPKGLIEYACEVEGVDSLVCFLEHTPNEEGARGRQQLTQ